MTLRLKGLLAIGLGFAVTLLAEDTVSASGHLVKAKDSIVKVTAGRASGTGFVWPEEGYIVTALHVVISDTRDIQVRFEGQTQKHDARLVKLLRSKDLALLKIEGEVPSRPPLAVQTRKLAGGAQLTALGFPLGIVGCNSVDLKVRRIGGKILRDIVPSGVLKELVRFGFPSVDQPIVDIEGHLLPGHSGSPILDGSGAVVAIANGGLESGAASMSWGIEADELGDLLASAEQMASLLSRPIERRQIKSLFSAELDPNTGKSLKIGDEVFVKLRTRSFAELAATADDALGLSQIANLVNQQLQWSGGQQVNSFRFDIYQAPESGAILVLPANFTLEPVAPGIVGGSAAGGTLQMFATYERVANRYEAEQKFAFLAPSIARMVAPDLLWQQDPQWSYVAPMMGYRGYTTRRGGAHGLRSNGFQFVALAYSFGTAVTSDREVFSVVGFNTALNNAAHVSTWGKIIIAAHLSGFEMRLDGLSYEG